MTPSDDLKDKYRASMLLSAAGDALGYKNQEWEYCKSGEKMISDCPHPFTFFVDKFQIQIQYR